MIAERHGRPVLAVKAGAVSQVPGQVHDSSASGSTLFVEPRSVLTIGNRLVDLEARIRDEERKVLAELSGLVAEEEPTLPSWFWCCCSWIWPWRGALRSLARGCSAAVERSADAPFLLWELRHPLLIWQKKAGGSTRGAHQH